MPKSDYDIMNWSQFHRMLSMFISKIIPTFALAALRYDLVRLLLLCWNLQHKTTPKYSVIYLSLRIYDKRAFKKYITKIHPNSVAA